MNTDRPRPDANHCFVCGPDNPVGLKIAFQLEEGICRARFTPGPDHGGWQGLTHGGILYSMLDDVMANWLFLQGLRGHTARCEIRYRQPVAVGTELLLAGEPVSRRRNMIVMRGIARRAADDVIVAEAQGTFMIVAEADQALSAGGDSKIPMS